MDTMTATKVLGGFCGALLIYLLGNWAAEEIYHVGGGHGGEYASGYAIEVAEAEVEVDEMEEEGPQFAELYLAADIDKGAKVFGKCKACHKLEDGVNGTGPHLYAVVDRAVQMHGPLQAGHVPRAKTPAAPALRFVSTPMATERVNNSVVYQGELGYVGIAGFFVAILPYVEALHNSA